MDREFIEQYEIYTYYYSKHYKLKYTFDVKWLGDKVYENQLEGKNGYPKSWGIPDKIIYDLHFRYLHKDLKEPVSFEEFINPLINPKLSNQNDNITSINYWKWRYYER